MKEFDIYNNTQREVVCVQAHNEDYYFPNATLLKEGKKYTVEKVVVYDWHTDVYLKEFPNKRFNSVQFGEIGA